MKNNRQRGFTLIEILVAVLVFGLGVLGVAGLSATSQKASLQAYHSMLATWKAQEMMESIRANRDHALSSTSYLRAPDASTLSEPANNCIQTYGETLDGDCTAAALAADDLYEWIESLKGYLPAASGAVSAASGSFIVTVIWDAGNEEECKTANHGYTTTVSGACQSVRFGL